MNQDLKLVGRAGLCFPFLGAPFLCITCIDRVLPRCSVSLLVGCLRFALVFPLGLLRTSLFVLVVRVVVALGLPKVTRYTCKVSSQTPNAAARRHLRLVSFRPFAPRLQPADSRLTTLHEHWPLLLPFFLPPFAFLSTPAAAPPAGAPTPRSRGCPWRTSPKTPGSAECPRT